MSNLPLGQIITTEQHKDAIHVAVAPVVAGEWLSPGAHVRISAVGLAVTGLKEECIGIVDPFLKQHVTTNERFWLFLYPGTITSLRHDWTHPAFEAVKVLEVAPAPVNESEKWLRNFAASHDTEYETIMQAARDWVESKERGGFGEYLCDGGKYEGEHVPEEFWPHYEFVTKTHVKPDHRESFFSCSC